jgi:tetratricopeptide (TPR) repeat protein/predicted Zn-dependent protease
MEAKSTQQRLSRRRPQSLAALVRAGLCWAFLLGSVGCRSKPGTSASLPTPPDVAEADLKLFLDGMLVTSNTPPSYETIWPGDDSLQLDFIKTGLQKGFYINSPEELRARLDVPVEQMTRLDGYLLVRKIDDYPTALRVWKRILREDPDDLEAALLTARFEAYLTNPRAALEDIARSSGRTVQRRSRHDNARSPGRLEGMRCALLLLTHRLEDALRACDLAIELEDFYASIDLVNVLLALGKNKEGLTQAQLVAKSPAGARNALAALALGLAQQYNGLEQEARATWNVALAAWPNNVLLRKAVSDPRRSIDGWQEEEFAEERPALAEELAVCGHYYSELGIESRAKECYRQSERSVRGPALAHQLVFLGRTKPDQALAQAIVAVKANPKPDLMSVVGWLYLHQNRNEDARVWVQRALDSDPNHVKSMSLMWQICGELRDYPCVIEFRKRLGLPTHFNVKEYKEATKAWQEQARKNGEGLAARDLDSASVPKPPRIGRIIITPLGDRVAPELAGMSEYLSSHFPGLTISIGPREELPPGGYKIGWRQVMWEDLLELLRDEPGRIYVVEQDLGLYDSGFAYVLFDYAHGRAVISVSRLRSLVGNATDPTTTLDGAVLTAASHRLQSQMLAATAKLLGVSFPCSNSACSMRERRAVTDFVLNEPAFCEAHQKELNAILAKQ